MSLPVTIVIPTLNEADQIADCVRHVTWADETIVADANSSDSTVSLARQAGALVLEGVGPTIAAQRNVAIARARNSWIFALDADERFSEELRAELPTAMSNPQHRAYRVRRRNFYLGSELRRGHWGRDWVTRLFTKECRWRERRVHETLEFEGEPGVLHGTLFHSPYRTLSHQLEKMDRYARWGAQDLYDGGGRASAWTCGLVLWDASPGPICSRARSSTADLDWWHLPSVPTPGFSSTPISGHWSVPASRSRILRADRD